jgi:hypothetical protein
MSPIEQEELRRQLDELIARGYKADQSPMDHRSFFVKKKMANLDVCGL